MIAGARGCAEAARARATSAFSGPNHTMPAPLIYMTGGLWPSDPLEGGLIGKGALSAADRLRRLAMAEEDATAIAVPAPLSKQPSLKRQTSDHAAMATVPPPLSKQPSIKRQTSGAVPAPLSKQPSLKRQTSEGANPATTWKPSAHSALELASSLVLGAHLARAPLTSGATAAATLSGHPAAAVRSARGTAVASLAATMRSEVASGRPSGDEACEATLPRGPPGSETHTSYQSGLRSIDFLGSVGDTLSSMAADNFSQPFRALDGPSVLVADEPVMLPGLVGLDWPDGATNWMRGRRLGSGTSGVVFLASPQAVDENGSTDATAAGATADGGAAASSRGVGGVEIAAKHMLPRGEEAMAALRDEIRLMRLLHHHHVVRYLGVASGPRVSDGQYILMEYCAGGSVGGLLRTRGHEGLPHATVHDYSVQLLRGLHFLHENMVIHRDLKGDNVLLAPLPAAPRADGDGEDGPPMRVKIADFGSASEIEYGTADGDDAEAGGQAMRGSPYWMAPEHIKGAACGRKADIWSFSGVVLEMITGRPPWFEERKDAPTGPFVVFQLLYRIAESEGPPPMPSAESMPRGYDPVLRACFERDAAKRPDSTELLRLLQAM